MGADLEFGAATGTGAAMGAGLIDSTFAIGVELHAAKTTMTDAASANDLM
jgi:hypothetical protein